MYKHLDSRYEIPLRLFLILNLEIIFPLKILIYLINESTIETFSNLETGSVTIFILFWIFISYLRGRYSRFKIRNSFKNYILKFRELIIISIILSLTLFCLKIINVDLYLYSKNLPFIFSIFISLSMLNELLINKIINLILPYKFEKIFFLGSNNDLEQIKSILRNYEYRNKINFDAIEANYDLSEIPDKLIISKENELSNESNLLKHFLKNGVQIFTKYSWFEYELNCLPVDLLDSEEVFYSKNFFNKKDFEFKIKRVGDILISSILIIFSSPIILICGILIWINDRGPIFYKQQREGLFREELNIYKLRTMVVNAEANGPQWAAKNDRRITLVGNILRKTRIDELPQLISVFKGEMSLIGPRPERPEFNKFLEKEIPYYNLRHIIKPGLSGWAQVNYPYGSSYKDSQNKLSYDLFYISNYSIFLDLIILFKTMRTVFSAKGAIPK